MGPELEAVVIVNELITIITIVTIVLLRLRRMLYIFELNFTRLIAVSKNGWIILASSISCEHRAIMVVFQLFTKGNQIL